jgi:hypothetical protein
MYVLVEGRKRAIEISKQGLGMPPMRSLVHMRACLVIAARRHEERVSAGAGRWSCSGLRVWQAVTCVWCVWCVW